MNKPAGNFTAVPNEALRHLGTDPVPVAPYVDPAYYALEQEAIFKRHWLHIGRVSEVAEPKSYIVRPIEAANASILIVHGSDGEIRAFHNVCTHRGTKLVWDDGGKAASFSCHYHMWNFANDGSLRAVPDQDRFFDLDKKDCGLKRVSLESCAGFLFVNLDPAPAQSLRDFLGPLAEWMEGLAVADATEFTEYTYEVDANWKTLFDNFQEVYHVRWVHDRSLGKRGTGPANPFGYASEYKFMGRHRAMTLWGNPDFQPGEIEAAAARLTFVGREDGGAGIVGSNDFTAFFPNTFLLPRKIGAFTQTVWPLGPERTRSVIRMYWQGEAKTAAEKFAREYAIGSLMDVHVEDRALVEAGQAGLRSGAIDKIRFQSQEAMCRHFINQVMDVVDNYVRATDNSAGATA
ncbi:MAG: aromatic ring-hydroxylating dioxygenase subunit alpha [Sphingobium sp.]